MASQKPSRAAPTESVSRPDSEAAAESQASRLRSGSLKDTRVINSTPEKMMTASAHNKVEARSEKQPIVLAPEDLLWRSIFQENETPMDTSLLEKRASNSLPAKKNPPKIIEMADTHNLVEVHSEKQPIDSAPEDLLLGSMFEKIESSPDRLAQGTNTPGDVWVQDTAREQTKMAASPVMEGEPRKLSPRKAENSPDTLPLNTGTLNDTPVEHLASETMKTTSNQSYVERGSEQRRLSPMVGEDLLLQSTSQTGKDSGVTLPMQRGTSNNTLLREAALQTPVTLLTRDYPEDSLFEKAKGSPDALLTERSPSNVTSIQHTALQTAAIPVSDDQLWKEALHKAKETSAANSTLFGDTIPRIAVKSEREDLQQGPAIHKTEGNPDVLLTIPKPKYPIQVYTGPPPTYSRIEQKQKMRWRHEGWDYQWVPRAVCIVEPDVEAIKQTVKPYLDMIGACSEDFAVDFLAEGGFNKVYLITTKVKKTRQLVEYVFRIALPIDPYYKVECDAATTELVRHATNVPVPIIYAYDTNSKSKLGFEWMLMERTRGESLAETWDDMDYEKKVEITKTVASWTVQLSNIKSSKIGGIFMRSKDSNLEFYVGQTPYFNLYQDNRLSYDLNRGPYNDLHSYYSAFLCATKYELDEVKHKIALDPERYANQDMKKETQMELDQAAKGDLFRQADIDDLEDEENWELLWGNKVEWLTSLAHCLESALPQLCVEAEKRMGDVSTVLCHDDVSLCNIMMDSNGTLSGLLDWEQINMLPPKLTMQIPQFLRGEDDVWEEPEYQVISTDDCNEEQTIFWKDQEKQNYMESMEEYEKTRLRTVYKNELKRLGRPILTKERDEDNKNDVDFETELDARIRFIWDWTVFGRTTAKFVEIHTRKQPDQVSQEHLHSEPTSDLLVNRQSTIEL